jgi:hypothetical protein
MKVRNKAWGEWNKDGKKKYKIKDLCFQVVSDYRLDDRAICVQTGSGAHPASCTMGTGGPFPGGKARPGRDADHSPPSSAEVKNE